MVDPQTFILTGTRGGPTRLEILEALAEEPRTVGELATALGSDPGALREHVAVLETHNMVDVRTRPDDTEYAVVDGATPLPI